MPADPRLVALLAALDDARRALADAVAAVPPERRATPPAPGRWSVAEILEHCGRVEAGATRLIAGLVTAAPPRAPGDPGPDPDDPTAWSLPLAPFRDRSVRVAAPEFLHPTAPPDAGAAWARLERSRLALVDTVRAGDGRALEVVSAPHPVFGPITAYQWISAIAGHDVRHALQVREAGEALAAPVP